MAISSSVMEPIAFHRHCPGGQGQQRTTLPRLARLDGPVLNKADSALVEGEASQVRCLSRSEPFCSALAAPCLVQLLPRGLSVLAGRSVRSLCPP